MIRRPPRSTRKESSAASDVYKRQGQCRQRLGGGVARQQHVLQVGWIALRHGAFHGRTVRAEGHYSLWSGGGGGVEEDEGATAKVCCSAASMAWLATVSMASCALFNVLMIFPAPCCLNARKIWRLATIVEDSQVVMLFCLNAYAQRDLYRTCLEANLWTRSHLLANTCFPAFFTGVRKLNSCVSAPKQPDILDPR